MKNPDLEKEEKLIEMIDEFSEEELDKLTQGNPAETMKNMDKKTLKRIANLAYLNLGKKIATEKEFGESIQYVFSLMELELLRRKGFVKRNKLGEYERTKLGDDMAKILEIKGKI